MALRPSSASKTGDGRRACPERPRATLPTAASGPPLSAQGFKGFPRGLPGRGDLASRGPPLFSFAPWRMRPTHRAPHDAAALNHWEASSGGGVDEDSPQPRQQRSAQSAQRHAEGVDMKRQMEVLRELDSEISCLQDELSRTSVGEGRSGGRPGGSGRRAEEAEAAEEPLATAEQLLELSRDPHSASRMRDSGCVDELIALLHPAAQDLTRESAQRDAAAGAASGVGAVEAAVEVTMRAAEALLNVVEAQAEERRRRRETKVVKLLGQARAAALERRLVWAGQLGPDEASPPAELVPVLNLLMQLSFYPEQRQAMAALGAVPALAQLLVVQHREDPPPPPSPDIRRYIGMSLTNLTFGDEASKALLSSFKGFLTAVVAEIGGSEEELASVFGSVLRNLSWKAEERSKRELEASGAVAALTKAILRPGLKDTTLKALLSALWNLSAHSTRNKWEICQTEGALGFLLRALTLTSIPIVENAGGVLRNVSSQIAVSEAWREVVREAGALGTLVQELESPSLTVVSNACGTLWNLSARCPQDQRALWELGAVPCLHRLVHSKHKNIAQGATAALRNLLSNPPQSGAGFPLGLLGGAASSAQRSMESQSLRSMEASTESERSFSSRHSAVGGGRQLVAAMGALVRPVELAPPAMPRAAVSCSPEPRSVSGLSRRASKEEVVSADRAAVLRYHKSLHKRYNHSAAHQGGPPQLLSPAPGAQPGPLRSSPSAPLTSVNSTPEQPVTHADLDSPLMGSLHSSRESLQDEQNSSDFQSNVPSVYSTRNPTGAVTPSELPDSPSRSMPVSPPPLDIDLDSSPAAANIRHEAEEDPEYAIFGRDDTTELLEKSMTSAYPVKSPTKPPRKSSSKHSRLSGSGREEKSPPDERDVPRRFGERETEETSANIMAAIDSALPKPRSQPKLQTGTPPKPVAVTKPMMRQSEQAPCDEEEEDKDEAKVFADEGTPFAQSRAHSPPPAQTAEPLDTEPGPSPKGPPPLPRWAEQSLGGESGIMGTSELSGLYAVSMEGSEAERGGRDSRTAYLMGLSFGASTTSNLEDVAPPDELMHISASSHIFRNTSTSEKVKDASNLLLKDSLIRQAAKAEESEKGAASSPVGKGGRSGSSEASATESLSEDNYSRVDDGETFDISPDDVDLSLVEEDGKGLVQRLLHEDELLIDCETLSLVSDSSMNPSSLQSSLNPSLHSSPARRLTPRIQAQPPPLPVAIRGQRRSVPSPGRGGRTSPAQAASGPSRPMVKTTKTAELRAKAAAMAAAAGLGSSPRGGEGRRGQSGDSRRGRRASPAGPASASESDRPLGRATRQLSRNSSAASATHKPPVPPKPPRLSTNSSSSSLNNNSSNNSSQKRLIKPKAASSRASQSPNANKGQGPGAPTKDSPQPKAHVKGTSKRMLVTTV